MLPKAVLEPILFLIYVNFVAGGVGSFWVAFADDFKVGLCFERDGVLSGSADLQRDLDEIVQRSSSWNLNLNIGKCVAMRFARRRNQVTNSNMYSINGRPIEFVSSYRDLGVIVDHDLKFHSHVNVVVGRASSLIRDLLRATVCRTRDFMVTLFTTHVRPMIDYCSAVWNVEYLADARRLESLQRRWTANIAGLATLPYNERLRETGLYSIAGRLLRLDLIKIWKILKLESNPDLASLFELSGYGATRGHRLKLNVPICHTEVFRRTLAVRRVTVWNGLPAEVVDCDSVVSFKRGLDVHLGDKLFEYF